MKDHPTALTLQFQELATHIQSAPEADLAVNLALPVGADALEIGDQGVGLGFDVTADVGQSDAVLHVTGVSSVTDYMVLCTGLNNPHLRALADEVARQLRLETPPVAAHRRAGSVESEWIVLDYFDFVVHLFTPAMRSYYALEQLWKDAPIVS